MRMGLLCRSRFGLVRGLGLGFGGGFGLMFTFG